MDALLGKGHPRVFTEAAALAAVLMEMDLMRWEVNPPPGPGRASGTWFKSQHW